MTKEGKKWKKRISNETQTTRTVKFYEFSVCRMAPYIQRSAFVFAFALHPHTYTLPWSARTDVPSVVGIHKHGRLTKRMYCQIYRAKRLQRQSKNANSQIHTEQKTTEIA